LNTSEDALAKEMEAVINNMGIATRRELRGKGLNIVFSSKLLYNLLSQCYDKNREKVLPPFARTLGVHLKKVLEYWLKGDGWLRIKPQKVHIGVTNSKALGLAMRDIAISSGKYACIRCVKRHRYGKPTKDQYWVEIKNTWPATANLRQLSSYEYGSRIRGVCKKPQITKEHYVGDVYNLQVKDDRSFIADGHIVHNCVMSLALATIAATEMSPASDYMLAAPDSRNVMTRELSPRIDPSELLSLTKPPFGW